jgi:Lytic polysaccharide mono-oxygenase, cellulose-degrading
MKHPTLICALAAFSWPALAEAHITLQYPPSRWIEGSAGDPQKLGPCGGGDPTVASGVRTKFKPGDTITLMWTETVYHPGHFRVAFDDDGEDAFIDPIDANDIVDPPVMPVLRDGLFPDHTANQMMTIDIKLPNITCKNCTLQVTQEMVAGTSVSMYYHCADIELANDATDAGVRPPPPADAATGAGGAGGNRADASAASPDVGRAGSGGTGGTGGTSGSTGSAGTGGSAGGTGGSAGGTGGSAGGPGGSAGGTGGAGGTAGSAAGTGGSPGGAGGSAAPGAGGSTGPGGPPVDAGAGAKAPPPVSGSFGCTVSPDSARAAPALLLVLGVLLGCIARRRSQSQARARWRRKP